MNITAIFMTVVVVFFASIEAFTFRWQLVARNNKEKQNITCPKSELKNQIPHFQFTATIKCNDHASNGGTSSYKQRNAAVGTQCTFVYSCSLDSPDTKRTSTMVCSKTGKWQGELPQCQQNDEMADAILDVFNRMPSETNDEEEEIPEETTAPPTTQLITTKTMTTKSKKVVQQTTDSRLEKFRPICKRTNMCKMVKSKKSCLKIQPKNTNPRNAKKVKEVYVGLCVVCMHFCSNSVTLL